MIVSISNGLHPVCLHCILDPVIILYYKKITGFYSETIIIIYLCSFGRIDTDMYTK